MANTQLGLRPRPWRMRTLFRRMQYSHSSLLFMLRCIMHHTVYPWLLLLKGVAVFIKPFMVAIVGHGSFLLLLLAFLFLTSSASMRAVTFGDVGPGSASHLIQKLRLEMLSPTVSSRLLKLPFPICYGYVPYVTVCARAATSSRQALVAEGYCYNPRGFCTLQPSQATLVKVTAGC